MNRKVIDYTSQAMTAQKRIAKGKATTNPRAKLLLRTHSAERSDLVPGMVRVILTMDRCLPLLRGLGQSGKAPELRAVALSAQSGASAGKPGPLRETLRIVRDLGLLVHFAVTGDQVRQERTCRAILLDYNRKTSRRAGWTCRAAVFLLAISGSRVALAQDAEVITPIQLFEAEAGKGLPLGGSFTLRPEVTGEVIHDTNIYNVDLARSVDTVFSVRPGFLLESNFPRHRIELRGGADIRRYAKFGGENSESADLGLKGLMEFGGWVNVQPELRIARGVEQRGTAGDQFLTDTPITYTRKEALLGIWRTQHRLEVALNGHLGRVDYNSAEAGGVPIDLSDRDLDTRDANLRLGLNVGERLQVFTQIGANGLSYRDPLAKQRNSSGYALLGGVGYEATSLIDVEAGFGYIRQNFENAAFKPLKAFNFHFVGRWTPKPRWLLTAGAERTVDGSPRSDVPAIFRTTYQLAAQRAMTDRLMLSGAAAYVREDYQAISRVDRRFEGSVSVQYRLTPNVGVLAKAGYRRQDGGLMGRSYEGVTGSLALRLVL